MSWTKDYHVRCDMCGKFCIPYDEETPYGSKYAEDPEPLDPYHYCKKCSKKLYKNWLNLLVINPNCGDWQKSNAEIKAAKKLGLVWDNSNFRYKKESNET